MDDSNLKIMDAKHYLLKAALDRKNIKDFKRYPFNIPAVKGLYEITFHPAVTFLVGENGAGKSTLIEAIALAYGFNAEGGSINFNFSTHETHSKLYEFIRLQKSLIRPKDGYFLRAESFYNVVSNIDDIDSEGGFGPPIIDSYGGVSLHKMSHGESFLTLMMNRFSGKGVYILDEPEATLSPSRMLTMLSRINELINLGSQFIISTHSPILMAYPDSKILLIDESGINEVKYEDTEHYIITKQFLNNRQLILNELFAQIKDRG